MAPVAIEAKDVPINTKELLPDQAILFPALSVATRRSLRLARRHCCKCSLDVRERAFLWCCGVCQWRVDAARFDDDRRAARLQPHEKRDGQGNEDGRLTSADQFDGAHIDAPSACET